MSPFPETRIRPLSEETLNTVFEAAGGVRAHPDQDTRHEQGADYLLGKTLIELKILDDEGLAKRERQRRLADLFVPLDPDRPVVVLDRGRLDAANQRTYDRALEGPIRKAVGKARRQLKASRFAHPDADRSVLMIVNNGNTALDQEEIKRLAQRRAASDTSEIDGVVVAGCYQHGDGFESVFLWPIEYVAINEERLFREFDALRAAFHAHAEREMTELVRHGPLPNASKGAVLDTGFDLDGRRFVKPAPPMGRPSEFYPGGRPRINTTGIDVCPTVALVFPNLSRTEWKRFRGAMPTDSTLGETYESWLHDRARAEANGTAVKPLVAMQVRYDDWLASVGGAVSREGMASVRRYANQLFQNAATEIIGGARDADKTSVSPSRYILVVTELIGQDMANDVSHIALVTSRVKGPPDIRPIAENLRIFYTHAIALAAAYAVKDGVDTLLWRKVTTYAWT